MRFRGIRRKAKNVTAASSHDQFKKIIAKLTGAGTANCLRLKWVYQSASPPSMIVDDASVPPLKVSGFRLKFGGRTGRTPQSVFWSGNVRSSIDQVRRYCSWWCPARAAIRRLVSRVRTHRWGDWGVEIKLIYLF